MKGLTTYLIALFLVTSLIAKAQNDRGGFDDGFTQQDNTFNPNKLSGDTAKHEKVIPRGIYVWTVDRLFGDRTFVTRDTLQHLFMNSGLTTGTYGEYNTTGNLGAPRINRIVIERKPTSLFSMLDSYDFFLKNPSQVRFTNTLSPITNLTFHSCGDRINGEDNFKAMFATNVNKQLGFGFKFDYLYGRGYYQEQATSLFDFTTWLSYNGDRYQAHAIYSTDHIKITENGGITDDNYIKHPEAFNDNYSTSEIPTNLASNWNSFHTNHFFLSHRYNVGFNRRVPMTAEERKAKEFALKSMEKNKVDLELAEESKMKGRQTGEKEILSGRPDDAEIKGVLTADSVVAVEEARIQETDGEVTDSLSREELEKAEAEKWMKNEYVPVTSFIHTLELSDYKRRYIANKTPDHFYRNTYELFGASETGRLDDQTKLFTMSNTFAIALLEGFNKWAKTGVKVFANHLYNRYRLPDADNPLGNYTESSVRLGGQLSKTQGTFLHYNVTGDICVLGDDFSEAVVDATADVNIPFLKDTLSIVGDAFFHRIGPDFYLEHFHSTHAWWDHDDLDNITHTHIGGTLSYPKTRTALKIGVDNIANYSYLAVSNEKNEQGNVTNYEINSRQASDNISLFTAQLQQDFRLGILNWENRITYQKSSSQTILPVPQLNVWTNLYLDFKIAHVLKCHFGASATYFTEYEAPEYCPQMSQFAIQENAALRAKVGNYPFVDVYANFVLKGCRFYVMMTHVNAGQGNLNYFTTPHHPMNDRIFRLGISWNFFN